VRSKFLRLGLNVWSTSDSGGFLRGDEIADAVDRGIPTTAPIGVRYPTAQIGVDLGLSRDRTAIVATDLDARGRLVVRHVEVLQGTRQHPVSLLDVEARVLQLAQRLGAKYVSIDRWQSAQMSESLRRRGLSVRPVTCDAAWLDRAATHLKQWFVQRHIAIPPHPALLEELEGLEAEGLRRRDRVRFTATGSNHDDICVALCLSAERFAGATRPDTSQIGRPKLAEIEGCIAATVLGTDDVLCPIAGEVASLNPGCARCPMVQQAEPLYLTHLQTAGEDGWIPLGTFAERLAPNRWLSDRRFRLTVERNGW